MITTFAARRTAPEPSLIVPTRSAVVTWACAIADETKSRTANASRSGMLSCLGLMAFLLSRTCDPPGGGLALEAELQAELDLAGRAERARDAPRGRRVDRRVGSVEARGVREVEALRAELDLVAEALEQREVEVLVAVFAEDVGPRVAVRELGRQDERRRVEPLVERGVSQLARAHAVRPLRADAGVGPVRRDRRRERPPAAPDVDGLHLPSSEEGLSRAVGAPQEALAVAHRQLPADTHGQVVRNVEARDRLLPSRVPADGRVVLDRDALGERVGHEVPEPLRGPPD